MIERRTDMPPGTLGFRACGSVGREDYVQTLLPALREAIEGGGRLRVLLEIGPDFEEFDPTATLDDAKDGLRMGLARHDSWERSAIVTDVPWIRRTAGILGIMVPGEFRLYGLDALDEAKAWLAAVDPAGPVS